MPDRILFGSCHSQHYKSLIWPSIRSRNAAAFVWAGDAIYADDFTYTKGFRLPKHKAATPEQLRSLFNELAENEGYKALLLQNNKSVTILGAIDDHDFGANNGDKTYPYKRESALAFIDFLQTHREASTDLSLLKRRAAQGKGAYGVKVFDFETSPPLLSDAGLESAETDASKATTHNTTNTINKPHRLSNRSVAVFTLDVRSHKTPWREGAIDYNADFLGAEQWEWLERGLTRSKAAVNIVVTGLQVHADRYYNGNLVEDWSRFPMAQHKLYQLLLKSNVSAPILVSGDVHMAELLRKDCKQLNHDKARLLLEVTTSGLTHSWGTNICARPHSSILCQIPYFSWSLSMGMHLAHRNYAWTDLVVAPDEFGDKPRTQYALEHNFGEMEFDWDKRQVIVRLLGERLDQGQVLTSSRWDMDLLSGKVPAEATGKVRQSDYDDLLQRVLVHGGQKDDFVCVNYNGNPSALLKAFGVASPILLAGFLACLPLLLPLLVAYGLKRRQRRKFKVD
jgi:alkaline phosphatase D